MTSLGAIAEVQAEYDGKLVQHGEVEMERNEEIQEMIGTQNQ